MSGSRRKPGRLGPFVDGYRGWLLERGYSQGAVVGSLITLGHLGRWMQQEQCAVDELTDQRVTAFVASYRSTHGHLPHLSVWPLVDYLRAGGFVAPERLAEPPPVQQLVDDYRRWLCEVRGLAPCTVSASVGLARRFLGQRAGPDDPTGAHGITTTEVTDFLVRECERTSVASAGCLTYRLRSLLRYLAARGLADPGVAVSVPRIARWRQTTVPRFPERPQIERLLDACDRDQRTGARNYAVLLLLVRLGLRAIEVARLHLDDLDWRGGQITVDGKGHRRDRLPLPGDVGEALAVHLRHRGHRVGVRHVFLTVHAPIRPLDSAGVRTIVRNTCRSAGVAHVPAHQLRHALASDLLREGASLVDVGQVLRHTHLQSTAIYAKVDLTRLRLAASPWPGASR
jgi:integrase